jgi:hypothetical protein
VPKSCIFNSVVAGNFAPALHVLANVFDGKKEDITSKTNSDRADAWILDFGFSIRRKQSNRIN